MPDQNKEPGGAGPEPGPDACELRRRELDALETKVNKTYRSQPVAKWGPYLPQEKS